MCLPAYAYPKRIFRTEAAAAALGLIVDGKFTTYWASNALPCRGTCMDPRYVVVSLGTPSLSYSKSSSLSSSYSYSSLCIKLFSWADYLAMAGVFEIILLLCYLGRSMLLKIPFPAATNVEILFFLCTEDLSFYVSLTITFMLFMLCIKDTGC